MQFFVYLTMTAGQSPKPAASQSPPSPEHMQKIMKWHQEQMEAGVIVATGRLDSTVTKIRKEGDDVSVTDGPFMEGKELIPGFTIIEMDTKEAATAWAKNYRDMMGMPELRIAEIKM